MSLAAAHLLTLLSGWIFIEYKSSVPSAMLWSAAANRFSGDVYVRIFAGVIISARVTNEQTNEPVPVMSDLTL